MAEPECIAATLAWCNERREEKGKKPLKKLPKGQRLDGSSCPCGKATGFHVGARYYGENADNMDTPLPQSVARFVAAFDGGRFPQYEAKA